MCSIIQMRLNCTQTVAKHFAQSHHCEEVPELGPKAQVCAGAHVHHHSPVLQENGQCDEVQRHVKYLRKLRNLFSALNSESLTCREQDIL